MGFALVPGELALQTLQGSSNTPAQNVHQNNLSSKATSINMTQQIEVS